MNIYQQIEFEDLSCDLKLLAEVCGIETIRVLLKNLSGLRFYIPRLSNIEKFIVRYIKNNKDKTLKQISCELKISEQHTININKKIKETTKLKSNRFSIK